MRIRYDYLPNLIKIFFYITLFILPLTFFTKTSELFEFNKMIVVYISTILITSLFVSDRIIKKDFKIKRDYLFFSIIIFLAALFLSVLVSIDFHTSLFGYYSRFHGGFTSYLSYAVLFFIAREIFDKKSVVQLIKVIIASTVIASVYATLEHFGHSISCLFVTGNFDVSCWVQDVQNRVFGTFGQPNWIAAWIVSIMPLALFMAIKSVKENNKYFQTSLYILSFFIMLLALYYTKSRSGFLAFALSYLTFWVGMFFVNFKKKKFSFIFKLFSITTTIVLLATLFVKTPWQPAIKITSAQEYQPPALEIGGTESGDIRKIVWKGAWDLFLKYPLFGTGLDTFAYSYYETRPLEHNLVSEWNFVYNRAHNEYLNFLATTGLIGTTAYVILIFAIFYLFIQKINNLNVALTSSFVSILITNFFGFSTVSIGLIFFMLPAISFAYSKSADENNKLIDLISNQKYLILILSMLAAFLLFSVLKYWYADYSYASAKTFAKQADHKQAVVEYQKAISLNNSEANYYNGIASSYLVLGEIENSVTNAEKALELSPHNVALHKQIASTYSRLASEDINYAIREAKIIEKLLLLAPTDPAVQYKYASLLAKNGKVEDAIEELKIAIQMKPNYKIANILLAYIYEDIGEKELAKERYEYILKYIDPNDEKIKEDLNSLNI